VSALAKFHSAVGIDAASRVQRFQNALSASDTRRARLDEALDAAVASFKDTADVAARTAAEDAVAVEQKAHEAIVDGLAAAANEKLNASQPDLSRVRALDEQIREQAAKASNAGGPSLLNRLFDSTPKRDTENARLQSLILQQVIERNAAIRQHAAEHPELYAEKSTP